MDWLAEFINSRIAKRIVFANYMEHLRLKNEGKSVYSDIEEALQDFARRTGLTEMQKRGLRRQTFVKIALEKAALKPGSTFQSSVMDDKSLFESDNAPASILPGVVPGSDLAKNLEETKKKKNIFKKLREVSPQQANRDIEERAPDEAVGSPDADGGVNAGFRPGLIIEAQEEDPWIELRKEPEAPKPKFEFKKTPRRRRGPGGRGKTSKEKNLMKKIQELQNQLVKLFMEPGGSISNPKWRKDLTVQERKYKIDLQSQINEVRGDLSAYRAERKEKQDAQAPENKAGRNNVLFLSLLDKELGVKSEQARKRALKNLSPEGLQDLYDRIIKDFRKDLYYKASQGYDEKIGDYVKCMVCDKHGITWIDRNDPGHLPFWHLDREHADELLGDTEIHNYREELVDAYLRKFPGAALQSREHELARFLEREAEKAADRPLIHAPHIATESEKEINYTDDLMLDFIERQFKRFGVDPDEPGKEPKTLAELAKETLDAIKNRLEEEFPGSLTDVEYDEEGNKMETIGQIGKVEDRGIPFEAFHRAFREEVGEVASEYRGAFSNFRPPTRRQKRRWTSTEREQARQERFKQLRREDIVNDLTLELGRAPSEDEIQKRIKDLDVVPVNISVTGGRACWNCGQEATVMVPSRRKIAINSATCPFCGVYREVLVETKRDDPESGWDGLYVIRDPNENSPGGVEYYVVYEDDDYIGDGPKAVGNSKYVHRLSRAEREIRTKIVDPNEESEVTEERYKFPLTVRDRVWHDQYGNGIVVYIEGSNIWVNFDNNPRTARLEDLEGEVVSIESARTERSGSYKVESVNIDRDMQTVEVWMRSTDGSLGTRRYNNLEILNQPVAVATEVSLGDLQKVSLGENRLQRRRYLLRLAQGRNKVVKVERYVKKEPESRSETPEKGQYIFKTPNARLDWLRGRVRRGRLLQHLFNTRWIV